MLKSCPDIVDVVARVNAINVIRDEFMEEGVHYGIVPGTKKMAIRKPGVDVLCLAFQFGIDCEIEFEEIEGHEGHREYVGKGTVTHIPTGNILGSGSGSCSTMESKYRYRWDYTKTPVPKKYWETRDRTLLGGEDFFPKKTDDGYVIAKRIENPDIADQYNTCAKMAEKRIRSACIQNVTACSSLFEQEDMAGFAAAFQEADVTIKETTEEAPTSTISPQAVDTLTKLLDATSSSVDKFLMDYLIDDVSQLEVANWDSAYTDIKSGKYGPDKQKGKF